MKMALLPTIVQLLMIFYCVQSQAAECPPEDEIQPCTCFLSDDQKVNVRCGQVTLYELTRTFDRLRGTKIEKMVIDEAKEHVPFLPEGLFRQTNLSHLLLYAVSMNGFRGPKPNRSPFQGVEDSLHTIEILWPIDGKGNFSWSDLTVLRNLKELRILGLHVPTIETFPSIPSLTILTMQHTLTDKLSDDAFVNLPNLERINIQDNNLTTMKRSMFVPNAKLQRINLSANRLVTVPTDMFTDMPDLEILTIAYNRIRNLPFEPFQISKTLTLDFTGNRINCNCNLKWMRDMAKQGRLRFQGDCSNVQHQFAKNIFTFFKKCPKD